MEPEYLPRIYCKTVAIHIKEGYEINVIYVQPALCKSRHYFAYTGKSLMFCGFSSQKFGAHYKCSGG